MAMSQSERKRNDARIRNNINTYVNFAPLYDLAITRFEWLNLPETVDARFLERALVNEGECIFFNEPDIGFVALPCTGYGKRDVYGRPVRYHCWGYNGFRAIVDAKDGTRILNNLSHTSIIPLIEKYTRILAELDAMLMVNVNTNKKPYIVQCTEEQKRSFLRLFGEITDNEPFIMADSNLDQAQFFKVIDIPSQWLAESIMVVYNKLVNRYLTLLGYENTNNDKKERMITGEISSNYGEVEAMRNSSLVARKNACKEINQKFGLNVDVRFRSDVDTLVNLGDEFNEDKLNYSKPQNVQKESEE